MNIIEVSNVTKRFGNKIVTDNLSLSIEKGEMFGLLGPNGAGKSTLMNQIVGLIQSDKGSIHIGGFDINKEAIKAKSLIGVVPQNIALFSSLNAYDNLEYFGGLYGLRGKLLKERIKEALQLVALDVQGNKLVKRFSGGMQRRLNIAAAVLHKPQVLIMDEPTVGIDPQSRNYIFEMIQKLNKELETTIIYTSHYMEEIELLCNKVCIIDEGKQIANGTKDEIKRMTNSDKVIHIKTNLEVTPALVEIQNLSDVRKVIAPSEMELLIVTNEKFELNKLILKLMNHGIGIKNLSEQEVSLEEVFLTLTGKKLRDNSGGTA